MCFDSCITKASRKGQQEYTGLGKSPELPYATLSGFYVCGDVFVHETRHRMPGKELRELLDVDHIPSIVERDQRKSQAKAALPRGNILAQLTYYNVSLERMHKLTRDTLMDELKKAVKAGKCDKPPATKSPLEIKLRSIYAEEVEKWNMSNQEWLSKVEKAKEDRQWGTCDMVEQLSRDPRRFLADRFCENGNPDKTKFTSPVVVKGLQDPRKVIETVKEITGLHVSTGGKEDNRFVAFGWDHAALQQLVEELKEEEKKEPGKESWNDLHKDFCSSFWLPSSHPYAIEDCLGRYVMKMPRVQDTMTQHKTLYLDIARCEGGVLVAWADFGTVRGTMLLGVSEDALKRYRKEAKNKRKRSGSASEPPRNKRKCPPTWTSEGRRGKDRHRLHFCFRGREAVSGRRNIVSEYIRGSFCFPKGLETLHGDVDETDVGPYAPISGAHVKGFRLGDGNAERMPELWTAFSGRERKKEERKDIIVVDSDLCCEFGCLSRVFCCWVSYACLVFSTSLLSCSLGVLLEGIGLYMYPRI